MKKFLYLIGFIFISIIFSGCFNERNIYSSDNQTDNSYIVSKNNIDIDNHIDNHSNNLNHLSNKDYNNSIQNTKQDSIDNKSAIPTSDLSSNFKNQITDLHISDSSLINKRLTGTYKIIFFGSQVINVDNAIFGSVADMYYISNDCKKAQKLYPDIINKGIKNQCSLLTQSKILDGIVTIYYDENNQINIVSRLQMEGGIIENSPADKYQYTVYFPIKDSVLLHGKGVTCWNYNISAKSPSNISNTFNKSPFTVNILEDGLMQIDMTLINKMIKIVGKNIIIDAKNTIILEKISSEYNRLENKVQKKFSR